MSWHLPGGTEENEQNYQSEQLLTRPDSNADYLKYTLETLSLHHFGWLRDLLTSAPNGLSGQLHADAHSIRG
jgi:hypothetical protein